MIVSVKWGLFWIDRMQCFKCNREIDKYPCRYCGYGGAMSASGSRDDEIRKHDVTGGPVADDSGTDD